MAGRKQGRKSFTTLGPNGPRVVNITHCHDTEMNDAETHTDVNNAHDMNDKNANTMMNVTAIHVDNDKC